MNIYKAKIGKNPLLPRQRKNLFPAAAFAVGAVAAAVVGKFAVETLGELLVRGFANRENLTGEVKRLAGQLVVEIHLDLLVVDLEHAAGNHAAVVGHHRDGGAHADALVNLAVALEHTAGEVEHGAGGIDAIALLGGEDEIKGVADFLVEDIGLELGQQVAHAKDKFQRMFSVGAVADGALHIQHIGEGDYFVVINFHGVLIYES